MMTLYKPNSAQVRADYRRAQRLRGTRAPLAAPLALTQMVVASVLIGISACAVMLGLKLAGLVA